MVGRKSLGSPARVDAGILMSRIRAGSSAQTCPFRNWYSTCTCPSDYWLHICEVLPQASSQQAMFCGENLLRFTARGRLGRRRDGPWPKMSIVNQFDAGDVLVMLLDGKNIGCSPLHGTRTSGCAGIVYAQRTLPEEGIGSMSTARGELQVSFPAKGVINAMKAYRGEGAVNP
jgi:hypothetical protein